MPTTYEMLTLPSDGDQANAGSVNDDAFRTIADYLHRYTALQALCNLAVKHTNDDTDEVQYTDVCWAPGTETGASDENDDGRFIAVGHNLTGPDSAIARVSDTGEEWAVASTGLPQFYPHGVAFQRSFGSPLTNKKVVAVGHDLSGGGRVAHAQATSLPSGSWTSWTPSPQPTLQLNHAVYAHPNWLIFGHYSGTNNGQIMSTTDLSTYVLRAPGGGSTANFLRGILHASGKVTAVGSGNSIQESSNQGSSWTQRTASGSPADYNLKFIVEPKAGTLIAAGTPTNVTAARRHIFRSLDDGATWAALETLPLGTGTNPLGVLGLFALGKMLIAVINDGLTRKAIVSFDYGSTWVASIRFPGASNTVVVTPNNGASSPSRLVIAGTDDQSSGRGLIWSTPPIAEWL